MDFTLFGNDLKTLPRLGIVLKKNLNVPDLQTAKNSAFIEVLTLADEPPIKYI